jgi:hypothetical protein
VGGILPEFVREEAAARYLTSAGTKAPATSDLAQASVRFGGIRSSDAS